jgi:mRNA interferase YafQ
MKLRRHKAFTNDFSKARLADTQFEKLIRYLSLLQNDQLLPEEALDHNLKGKWSDFREFHLGGDMLIIYKINVAESEIVLSRLGTHSQLFE